MEKLRRACERFERALKKFTEVVGNPSLLEFFREEFIVEITTKRFEYTYESMWKCVKEFLMFKGIECNSPRSCFRELIKEGVLSEDYESVLARLVTLRNELVHVYDEKRAKGIYEEIKTPVVLQTLKEVLKKVKGELSP